jgi:hypothetical protein
MALAAATRLGLGRKSRGMRDDPRQSHVRAASNPRPHRALPLPSRSFPVPCSFPDRVFRLRPATAPPAAASSIGPQLSAPAPGSTLQGLPLLRHVLGANLCRRRSRRTLALAGPLLAARLGAGAAFPHAWSPSGVTSIATGARSVAAGELCRDCCYHSLRVSLLPSFPSPNASSANLPSS